LKKLDGKIGSAHQRSPTRTVRDLAEKAGIHRNTISAIETGRSEPTPETMATLQKVLEKAGVEFTNGKRPGVRLNEQTGKSR